jgi:hypothetical protein
VVVALILGVLLVAVSDLAALTLSVVTGVGRLVGSPSSGCGRIDPLRTWSGGLATWHAER